MGVKFEERGLENTPRRMEVIWECLHHTTDSPDQSLVLTIAHPEEDTIIMA